MFAIVKSTAGLLLARSPLERRLVVVAPEGCGVQKEPAVGILGQDDTVLTFNCTYYKFILLTDCLTTWLHFPVQL